VGKADKHKKHKRKKSRSEKLKNPPKGVPQCAPYLHYSDPRAAVSWLCNAFDLEESLSVPDESGGLAHAELRLGKALFMLGPANAAQGTCSPRDLSAVHQSLYVYVHDVDAHCERAREPGAVIAMDPQDMFWGDRVYSARDCEGHHWSFAQHVRDVDPSEIPGEH